MLDTTARIGRRPLPPEQRRRRYTLWFSDEEFAAVAQLVPRVAGAQPASPDTEHRKQRQKEYRQRRAASKRAAE